MGIGISIVLFGIGAVLTFALEREAKGINLDTVGIIMMIGAVLTLALEREAEGINLDTVGIMMMIVGGIGPVVSMLFWGSWGRYRRVVRERAVTVKSADPAGERERIR